MSRLEELGLVSLSEEARSQGICPRRAQRLAKAGKVESLRLAPHFVVVRAGALAPFARKPKVS